MPDPAIAAAAINAAGQAGQGVLGLGTAALNRKWSKKDYKMMRADNLADWHMQNAYNSPAAQMQRLKDAGLNPHLVYGTGAVANNANAPRNAEISHVQMEPPQFDASSVIGSYLSAKMNQAQVDNLAVQKTVMEQEAILKSVQALQVLASTDKTKEETTNIQLLRSTTIEAAKKNIEKLTADIESTKANTAYTINENMRKQELQPITIRTMNEQIKNMIEQRNLSQQQREEILNRINNMVKDGLLKDWEIKLSQQGLKPSDPLWQRKLTQMLNEAAKPIRAAINGEGKWIKKPTPKTPLQWLERFSPY